MSDALALLDHEEIDQTRRGVAKQRQVLLPVSWRMRERPHGVEGQRERGTVTSPCRESQVPEDLLATDP
jgi:hypothetical protein